MNNPNRIETQIGQVYVDKHNNQLLVIHVDRSLSWDYVLLEDVNTKERATVSLRRFHESTGRTGWLRLKQSKENGENDDLEEIPL